MSLLLVLEALAMDRFPRMRGDEPPLGFGAIFLELFSPHARG